MTHSPRSFLGRRWLALIPICAAALLIWSNGKRIERVDHVTNLTNDAVRAESSSVSGYAGGGRQLIVPERLNESYGWIAQTQLKVARGDARLHRVDYENAPFGRVEYAASLYGAWLRLVARVDQAISDRSPGLSVERAALYADPLLHLLLLGVSAGLAWRNFGALASAVCSVGWLSIYPLGYGFLPGTPDDSGFFRGVVFLELLFVLIGLGKPSATYNSLSQGSTKDDRGYAWVFAAGALAGVGLWLDVFAQLVIGLAIGLGMCCAARLARHQEDESAAARWISTLRSWGLVGAVSGFIFYLVEHAPAHLGEWQLRTVHPLYSVAWLGGAELLAQLAGWRRNQPRGELFKNIGFIVLASLAIAAVPVAVRLAGTKDILATELSAMRLTALPDGVMAPGLKSWLTKDGFTLTAWATLLPLGIVAASIGRIFNKSLPGSDRQVWALLPIPALAAGVMACLYLSWWHIVDVVVLVILVVVSAGVAGNLARWTWAGLGVAVMTAGLLAGWPSKRMRPPYELSVLEVEQMIERDLARWLAARLEHGAVVLAPPGLTTTLHYYGGLHGVGTFALANKEGLSGAIRIMSATSGQEALTLLQGRRISHIVLPSWETFFEDYIATIFSESDKVFVSGLKRWALPTWLKPVPYQVPRIQGFENHTVMVFEVVEEQGEAIALSRLAEYFVETGQPGLAGSVSRALQRYPGDLSALAARAQVDADAGDQTALARVLDSIKSRLGSGAERLLPWDRRLSLTIVLARAQQMELASAQLKKCVVGLNEQRLRSLSTASLFNFLVLSRALKEEIPDARLKQLAHELVPTDLRSRL